MTELDDALDQLYQQMVKQHGTKPKAKPTPTPPVPVKQKMKPRITRRHDFAIMLLPGMRYKLTDLDSEETLKYRGHQYAIDKTKRRVLIGWRPEKKEGVFSDILARDGIKRTLIVYPEPSNPENIENPITPLDRLTEILKADKLTPQIHRAYFVSNLYRDRMRKTRIGGADLRLVFIMLGIVGLILALLYFSGYFG